jgi:3D (Asp-Asp-Asp) domain-containing protein
LPIGTVVRIEGLDADYVVEDIGGAVDGQHIDLYIADLDRAKKWGKQTREVTVIEWGERSE